jgi:ubiquinone/menaquinone biosynthesis C-methylase UbiE
MVKFNVRENYLSEKDSEKYDKKRFGHLIGKIIDKAERLRVIKGLELCGVQEGNTVCDLACGTGRICETLIEYGLITVGIDYSFQMLSVARKKRSISQNVKGLIAMDAVALAFKDKTFDFTTSMRFFGHISSEERIRILEQLSCCTKKNIVIAYYSFFSLHTLYRFLRFMLSRKFYGYTVTRKGLEREVGFANLRVKRILPILRFIHQGWIVVLEHV